MEQVRLNSGTVFYVKHVVCRRGIRVLRELLVSFSLTPIRVELGEAEVAEATDTIDWPELEQRLLEMGFALLYLPRQRVAADIKALVMELLSQNPDQLRAGIFPPFLSQRLGRSYGHLSHLFRVVEGSSLEHFIMAQRIARVRELLADTQLTISRIAQQQGFSSLGHLSRQFRRYTGLTPTVYRQQHALGAAAEAQRR
ncbi:hypothetical protein GCM10023172_42600 [Hymenobacter ginsengisoli]|uniref:HTH araC/xylS-type domain-containing protein n=1 Tax=Hymenobacter ginsengisoli TaxID=1051626 RepID=A0ABP8QUY9_9BACT|nr:MULTISPECIES: AraC family transcriptional regulator [unclassified Hymenobacter]MBO2033419.1 helix-turn-helix transcriptional regulator [Hymenobacter sp. BT559]